MAPASIVHVISGLDTGGAEMMLLRLLGGTDRRRWAPAVVSLRDRGTVGARVEELGVPVKAMGMRGVFPTLRGVGRLMQELRTLEPRLLLGWMYHGNAAAWFGRKVLRTRIPVVWNIRYAPDRLGLEKATTAAVVRAGAFLSSRVDRIVYNSRAGAKRHAELGYASERAVVIPNGFETERFIPSAESRVKWRRRLGLSESALLIGRVGRYHAMKDHSTFLEAARLLALEQPDVHFVLAGKDVDSHNRVLSQAVAHLGLEGRAHLLGEVASVADLTAALDIACSSSAFGEAFPNVLGEAMACGVPCVTTDVGDSSWIVGDHSRVVAPRDPSALAAAFSALIDVGPMERKRLGAEARSRVVSEFALPRALEAYDALCSEVIA